MKGIKLIRLIAMIIGLAIILTGMIGLTIGLHDKDTVLDEYFDNGNGIMWESMSMTDFGATIIHINGSQTEAERLESKGLTSEYFDSIYQKDVVIFIGMGIIIVGGIIFILSFLLLNNSSFLCARIPKDEKSSTGLSARLVSFLSYLTLGVVGLFYFFFEKTSRFAKHNAIQALMTSLLMATAIIAANLMNLIFSYMFPPIAFLLEMLRFTVVSYAISTAVCAIVVSAFGRSFKMPFVGRLSENSSYCD